MYYDNGKIMFDGIFNNGVPNGKGKLLVLCQLTYFNYLFKVFFIIIMKKWSIKANSKMENIMAKVSNEFSLNFFDLEIC